MAIAQRIHTVFIEPESNLKDTHDPQYKAFATLDPQTIRDRWSSDEGQQLLHLIKSNDFERSVLQSYIGKFYDRFDLRGIPLSDYKLIKGDLSHCDFFNADLRGSKFDATNFDESFLSEADIRGTSFDWCKMDGVFVDNVNYDASTSFVGVDLNKINFTLAALLREKILGQQLITDLESNHKAVARILKATSNYGRSFWRFALWCIGIVVFFGLLFSIIPDATTATSVLENMYFSVLTFTTLGFGSITPVSWVGKVLVIAEVISGYFMMGLLIAILGTKVLRF